MAPRPFWKGYLKLSLVTCPVAMMPATSDRDKLRFHTLNARTGNRVVSRYVDAVSGDPLAEEDEVKGYQHGEDEYVMLEDDEIANVALDSTRTIDIDMFVPDDSIGWIWYDRPHYLLPDDPIGEEAFAVIRNAMAASGTVGISRLVLYRRERAVMLRPRGRGIVLWTLRYGDEVRPEADYFPDEPPAPERRTLRLVEELIDAHMAEWSPDMVRDPVQERLQDIVRAKTRKRRPARRKSAPASDAGDNTIDIMEALRRSIGAETRKRH